MKKSDRLISKIRNLPDSPGVYKFLDSKRKIIYIGKAISLKKRVASYFRHGKAADNRLELLRKEVKDVDYITASSEAEALIYEAGLIKDHCPKFNIELKDDKSYPFLKLSLNEKYPRLIVTRRRQKDGAIYYGPYVNVKLLKEAVSFMKIVFPLRSCRVFKKKVCLEYHIDQCYGPCEGKISLNEYSNTVKQLKKFLEGKKDDLVENMRLGMKKASDKKKYEKAINIKRRIEALTAVQQLSDRSQRPVFGELDELKNVLNLRDMPLRIECFDISNISGYQSVGAMVTFVAGRASRSEYRRFRIKESCPRDDYSMICEVVNRRYTRMIKENRKMPDVIMIDGGRGHLSVANSELKKMGLADLVVISIAKEHNHLYGPSWEGPLRLSPGSRLLSLIQRIRDEAHRFAITYHRKLRKNEKFVTELINIKGIGKSRERMLMEKFGSIDSIIKMSAEELGSSGIGKGSAIAVKKYFERRQ